MKKNHLQLLTPAALYARVSSDRQDVDLSVSAQLRALKDYARANDYSVAREYIDEAESGRVANRPQFREMIEEGSKPKAPFDVILVWKFSRFTRKREHAVAFKSQLRRKGIRVVSITEQAEDNATGRLLEGIIESVDEYYSENLAQEVVRGMREAASRGRSLGSKAPFGYRKVKVSDGAKERPILEVDPATAPVVKEIFEKSLRGSGLKELCKELNERGVTNRGKRWNKGGLHYVLRNEAYTGAAVWGKISKGEKTQDPVRVEGAWPALVSRDLFDNVQEAMRERAPKVQRPARVGSPYLLSGLLRCGVCGKPYSAQGAKSGQFAYYICGTLFREGAGTCSARYLNAPKLETFVVENMDERQSIRKIALLVGGGLKPLRISDKAEAPQGPLPRHESTRNRLSGPCGVCGSLSSRLPAVRSSFVERGALHGNCRADSCGREDVSVLSGPALGGLHAGRKAQGLEAHPVRPVVLAVREGDPAGAAGRERFDQRIMCPTCHPTIGDGDDFTASNG